MTSGTPSTHGENDSLSIIRKFSFQVSLLEEVDLTSNFFFFFVNSTYTHFVPFNFLFFLYSLKLRGRTVGDYFWSLEQTDRGFVPVIVSGLTFVVHSDSFSTVEGHPVGVICRRVPYSLNTQAPTVSAICWCGGGSTVEPFSEDF